MKFCVIGAGRFGYSVATMLAKNGCQVLAVDSNEAIISSLRDKVSQAICMTIRDEDGLRAIGVDEMDTVIVAMGENFAQSILVTALLKQRLKVPHIITRSISQIHKEILELVGSDEVILPERDAGALLADRLSLPFKTLFRLVPDYSISEIAVPEGFVGTACADLLMQTTSVKILGRRVGKEIEEMALDTLLQKDDILVLAGTNADLAVLGEL
jgi:trk system potassium uptake protein TrkA